MSNGQTAMWQRRHGGGDTGEGEGGGYVVPMPPPAPGSARTPHGRLRLARAVPVEHAMEVASLAAPEEAMALHGGVHGHGHRQRRAWARAWALRSTSMERVMVDVCWGWWSGRVPTIRLGGLRRAFK